MDDAPCRTTFSVDNRQERESLWEVYHDAFSRDEARAVQEQQCYDRDSFEAALADPDYVKFVLAVDGETVGYLIATNDLEKARVAYVNPARLRAQYPDETAAGTLWYVTSFAVRPARQGQDHSGAILEALAAFMDERGAMIAYDYATDKMPRFPAYVERYFKSGRQRRGRSPDGVRSETLGGQTYMAVKFAE